MQPIFAALTLFCAGDSTLTDNRFQDRFQYVDELRKFGAPDRRLRQQRAGRGRRAPAAGARARHGPARRRGGGPRRAGHRGRVAHRQLLPDLPRLPLLEEKLRGLGADVSVLED
jgi:hypothetical protein